MKYKREILVSIEWLVAVLLILFPVVKIVQFVNQEITAEIAASKPMMAFAVETEEPVVEIVRSIDNNRIAEAQGLIGKMLFDDSVPKTVNEYFNEFNAYYAVQEDYKRRNLTVPSKSDAVVDALYFVRNAQVLVSYLESKNIPLHDAYRCAEVVPFYCIRNYEKDRVGQNNLYASYLMYLCEPIEHLSEYGVKICCMSVWEIYRSEKSKNKQKLVCLQITETIKNLKQKYERDLGENGIYKNEVMYLDRVMDFCNRKRAALWGLTGDNFPKYVME